MTFFCNLCLILLAVTACKPGQITSTEPQIYSAAVTKATLTEAIKVVGNVESSQSSTLTWKTSGVIESVSASVGETVTSGQELATLAEDSLPQTVLAAEATKVAAADALDELLVSETAKAQSYKELRDAETALRDAELFAEGLKYPVANATEIKSAERSMLITREAYDAAKSDYQSVILRDNLDAEKRTKYATLQSTLTAYAKAYDLWLYYLNNTSESTKEKAAVSIKEAEAAYNKALDTFKTYQVSFVRDTDQAAAEVKLDEAVTRSNQRAIAADMAGTITQVNAEVGKYVKAGDTALRIDNLDTLMIHIDVSEVDVNKLEDGMQAQIVLDAQTAKVYDGVVRQIATVGTASDSRVTYQMVIQFTDPDEFVKVGMTGEVSVVLSEKANVLAVPLSAVTTRDGQSFVQLVKDGALTETAVATGITSGNLIEISPDTLQEGDMVQVASLADIAAAAATGDERPNLLPGGMGGPGPNPPGGSPGGPGDGGGGNNPPPAGRP